MGSHSCLTLVDILKTIPGAEEQKNNKSNMDSLPTMGDMPTMPSKYLLLPTWVFVVLSILFPPAAVFMLKDIGLHLVISIILTIFCWVPGVLHALYISLTEKNVI